MCRAGCYLYYLVLSCLSPWVSNLSANPLAPKVSISCYSALKTSCTWGFQWLGFFLPPGKNKRVGKQLASQKILQMLHPHVKNWGSLLRMYGRESNKMVKKVISFFHTYCRACLVMETSLSCHDVSTLNLCVFQHLTNVTCILTVLTQKLSGQLSCNAHTWLCLLHYLPHQWTTSEM